MHPAPVDNVSNGNFHTIKWIRCRIRYDTKRLRSTVRSTEKSEEGYRAARVHEMGNEIGE